MDFNLYSGARPAGSLDPAFVDFQPLAQLRTHARTHATQTQTRNTISRFGVAALFSPQTSDGYDVLDIHAMVFEIPPLPYNNNMLIMYMNVCIVN